MIVLTGNKPDGFGTSDFRLMTSDWINSHLPRHNYSRRLISLKTVRLLLLPLLLAGALCACARAERFGVWELERRLREADKNYAFDMRTMFRKEGVYYVFYPAGGGTVLLKAAEDERQRLDLVSLTVTDRDAAEDFSALACAVTEVFLPPDAAAEAKAQLQLADPATFFRDETLTASYGRYSAVFFKTVKGVSLMLRYGPPDGEKDPAEDLSPPDDP